MPTYEYRCRDCSHELEVQQSFDDEPLTECPSCGGDLRKKFSAVGISFKGSGFYKTDSRSGSSKGSSSSSPSGEGPSGAATGDSSSSTASTPASTSSGSSDSSTSSGSGDKAAASA